MCSDRYADDMPLEFLKTQLPPTRSVFSKQSNAIPRWASALTAAMPDEPAPMTQTESDTGVNFHARVPSGADEPRRR